jgi:multiple sugar transport system permease protein
MNENQQMDMSVEDVVVDVPTAPVAKKKRVKLYSEFEKRDFFFAYLLCLIPVAHFCVFWLYTNFSSITLAFTDRHGNLTTSYLESVIESLLNGKIGNNGFVMAQSLKRSLFLWFFSNLVCYPLGLMTVYVLTCKIRGHFVYRISEILPSLLGSVIWSIVMQLMLTYNGPVVSLLQNMNIELPKTILRNGLLAEASTAFPSLVVIMFMGSIVSNSPIMTGAFSRIGDELLESAELDGAGFWRQFITIAIPAVWPTITTTMVFKLTGFFTADCGVFLYTNGTGQPDCSTIGFEMFYMQNQLAEGGGSYGYPSAFGLVLTFITFPICIFGRWGLERLCDTIEN